MKFRTLVGVLLSVLATQVAQAVSFTVNPSVVSNDYNGVITVQVSGLPAGETVQLVQHTDFNGNGTIEAQDIAVRAELIRDGDAKLFGTNVNINLVRDEDGATNGAINASIRFQLAPYAARAVGEYVFECISPSSAFATVTAPFTVVNAAYGQTVSGAVTCNGTNIPNARVMVVNPDGTDAPRMVVMGTADATGHYSLNCPTGVSAVGAFQSGYVAKSTNFPHLVVSAGVNATADVALVAATRILSGAVVDAANLSVHVIPCAEVAVTTTNYDWTLAQADTNGNFVAPLTAGAWKTIVMPQSAQSQGYMLPDPYTVQEINVTTADVTTARAVVGKGTALLYGRVLDNNGNPIPNVDLFANADYGQYDAYGKSDSNGNYAISIDSGYGYVSVIYSAQAPLNNYVWRPPTFSINDGQAMGVDITAHIATAHIYVQVTDDLGTPLTNLFAAADSYADFGTYSYANTDSNGVAAVAAYGGTWNVSVYGTDPTLIFPDAKAITLTDGVDVTNKIVAIHATGNISGFVRDTMTNAVSGIPVIITNNIGTTNFTVTAYTDAFGYYSANVFNGTWNVWAYLEGSTAYLPVAATNVVVPPLTNVVNFIAQMAPPPTILTTALPEGYVNQFYGAPLEETNGAYPITWSLVAGSLPTGIDLDSYGYLSGTPTIAGTNNFTLMVTDGRGSNDVKALQIVVRTAPSGPPTILSTYFTDASMGCSYSNMLVATNGSQPYTWTLINGSTMPPGLVLDPSGVITGVPATNDYFTFSVQCTGSDNSYVTATVSFTINQPLTMYPYPLPAGGVGTPYFGSEYAFGGSYPQTWSIVAGTLPAGLTLDPATGYINGSPLSAGVSQFTLRVNDGCSTIDTPLAITNYPALKITTTKLPVGQPNVAYNGQFQVTGGLPPYGFSIYGNLPYGLTGNTDGTITGTPYYESTNTVTCYVYDAAGLSTSQDFTLIISSQAPATPPTLDQPTQGSSGFAFRVSGSSGQSYTLQSTVDLTKWADLFTTNAPSDVFTITDTNSISGKRYYRLRAGQ